MISPDVNSLKSVKAKEAFYKCLAFALHMYVSLYVNIIMGTVFRIAICMNKNVVTLCLTDAEMDMRWFRQSYSDTDSNNDIGHLGRPVYPYGFAVIPTDSDLKFHCYAGWVKNYGHCPIFPFPHFKLE